MSSQPRSSLVMNQKKQISSYNKCSELPQPVLTQLPTSCKSSVLLPKVKVMKKIKLRPKPKHKHRLNSKLNRKRCVNNRNKRKLAKRKRKKLSESVNKKRNNVFNKKIKNVKQEKKRSVNEQPKKQLRRNKLSLHKKEMILKTKNRE